jgi:hypothetical protein
LGTATGAKPRAWLYFLTAVAAIHLYSLRILSQLLSWAMKARYNRLPMFFFHSKAPFILINAEIAAVIKKASDLTGLAFN